MNAEDPVRAAIGQLVDAAPSPPSWESVREKLPPAAATREAAARWSASLGRRRRAPRAALAALVAVALLSVPAVGAVREIASWLSGAKDPDAPVPSRPDVVLASGVSGAMWEIVGTPSDQGPCVAVRVGTVGLGGCGPSDVRGDPAAAGRAVHSVQAGNGSGGVASLDRSIVHGWAAEDVASVELVLIDGRSEATHLLATPDELQGPAKFFWAALSCGSPRCVDQGPLVRSLVARDASGKVLERRDVHDPKATVPAEAQAPVPRPGLYAPRRG